MPERAKSPTSQSASRPENIAGILPAFLVRQAKLGAGRQYALDKPVLTIGRLEDNDIAINDTRVSRRHAHIRQEDFRYLIEDLGSTNGTWLNGARLAGSAQLRHGDQIQIADVVLIFNDPNTTTQAQAFRPLALDQARGQVIAQGRPIRLTAKELALLQLLMNHVGELCSKDAIAQAVWPEYNGNVGDCNIEGLVSRLRRKIEPDPNSPIYLHTQRGLGYMLVIPAPSASPPTSNE